MNAVDALLLDAYQQPPAAIAYALSRTVAQRWSDPFILETEDGDFDLDTFLEREPCEVVVHRAPHPVVLAEWHGEERGRVQRFQQGHRSVTWSGTTFEVIRAAWPQDYRTASRTFFIGPSRARVEAFVDHVARVAGTVRDEVMVFANGCWSRSKDLRAAIRSSTFDNLVLPGDRGRALLQQCQQFLGAREEYARFGVPWKRGVLLLGPPGNGKTHCIKALLNALDIPCLYVKSFTSPYGPPQENVHSVFARARRTTPCALVLEDLDSLLTDETRSFFLNELDGFASNEGILTLASTNHPDKLDPAIVHRPSRFDRKVHFDLPDETERLRYLRQLDRQMGAVVGEDTAKALAGQTSGFSFAYIKELMVSAVTSWISEDRARPLATVADEQCHALRAQLASLTDARPGKPSDD